MMENVIIADQIKWSPGASWLPRRIASLQVTNSKNSKAATLVNFIASILASQ